MMDSEIEAVSQEDESDFDDTEQDYGPRIAPCYVDDDGCNESQPTQNGSPDPADWDDDEDDVWGGFK